MLVYDGSFVEKVFHKNDPLVVAENMRLGELTYHQHEGVRVEGLFDVMMYISEHEKIFMK
jgi:hypothetical protein